MRILCAFPIQEAAGATCPCSGITVNGTDQEHCWQIQSRSEATWGSADDACVAVGGHLGHPLDINYEEILNYVQKQSSLPVLTGIVAGNTEIPIYGAICQSNNFYEVVANTTGFSNTPTSTTTCAYIKTSSSGLVFDSCSIDANVLCDRPLQKQDYCSIIANCSSTTTFLSTTTPVSSTTSNISLTSSSTQSYSSSTAGATSSLFTIKVTQSTTAAGNGQGGSGSGSATTTCKCSAGDVSATTAASACSEKSGCLKNQWKIFGMCVDWRAMLALLLIGLLLFLCCCICHCCMHACMFCTPGKREKEDHEMVLIFYCFIIRDPILPNRSVVAPIPIVAPGKMDYDVEKSEAVILPPPAIQPEPVYITVPEKHESVYGFHTKEIIHVMPEKPTTREIGTMTDPMDTELSTIMPVPVAAPVMKRKKVVKKPKKMFIPATEDPIEEDLAADIPIEMPESPGARSVAPLGDVVEPAPMIPLNFSRNPKPMMPEPQSHDDIPLPVNKSRNTVPPPVMQQKPNNASNNEEFDPSGLRSPPIPAGKPNNGTPKRMTFSPIADESEEENGARIPSPPRERRASGGRPGNNDGPNLSPNAALDPHPTLKNQRLNEMPSPTPANAPVPSKSPVSGASNNPFANLGGPSPAPAADGAGRAPQDDVGMRAARGRLGGAVRGGGGGGEAPNGWKPWAKGGARR
eukprot:NP_001257216.1 Coexpressed With Polycystins [Caenorhabditis elegans]